MSPKWRIAAKAAEGGMLGMSAIEDEREPARTWVEAALDSFFLANASDANKLIRDRRNRRQRASVSHQVAADDQIG